MSGTTRQHGISLLEFAVVILIVVLVVLTLIPRIGDGLKWAHESVVRQTSVALRDNLELLSMKVLTTHQLPIGNGVATRIDLTGVGNGNLDINDKGFPVGTDWRRGEQRSLRSSDCEALWLALLGPFAPSARQSGESDFRVLTTFDPQHGLGCRFRYLNGGDMALDFYPDDGTVVVDDRF